MNFLSKTSAADLRQRADTAEQNATAADQRAGAARAEAAGCLADGNAEGARRARGRAIELATEADTQRDLAAELHRRGEEAAKAERLAAYGKARADAAKAAADTERLIRGLLDEMAPRILAVKAAHQVASAKCQAVSMSFIDLPQELEAEAPPSVFDPLLTDGVSMTRFGALPAWRLL